MIELKYKTSLNNKHLDLSQDKTRFNIDHLFYLPDTSKSLVFFPYHFDPDSFEQFNSYCKDNSYRIIFVGGRSVYGGIGPFTNGTMTVLLIHKDDDNRVNFLSCLNLLKVPISQA
jgi:hypothetical protein